jgi:L-lactate dehydrogenase complex protein LldG
MWMLVWFARNSASLRAGLSGSRREDLMVDALGFLSQHLIVLLDPEQIVADMHEAYARVRLDQTAYGCFMMGPSATGDTEATLVHGAQGARSLNVFFLTRSAELV